MNVDEISDLTTNNFTDRFIQEGEGGLPAHVKIVLGDMRGKYISVGVGENGVDWYNSKLPILLTNIYLRKGKQSMVMFSRKLDIETDKKRIKEMLDYDNFLIEKGYVEIMD